MENRKLLVKWMNIHFLNRIKFFHKFNIKQLLGVRRKKILISKIISEI